MWILQLSGAVEGKLGPTPLRLKITTFVVLVLTIRAFFQQRDQPVVMRRRLSSATVNKAVAVAMATAAFIFLVTFALTITEADASLENIAFETVSAMATVGLSLGLTGELSTTGQVLIIITMIVGRVGPLSLGYRMAKDSTPPVRYPQGSLQIG